MSAPRSGKQVVLPAARLLSIKRGICMKTVATTDHYVIEVDEKKNRILFTMKGSWTSTKAVPNWLEDVKKALQLVRPGFTELVDWTAVGAIALTDYIAAAQDLAMKAGLRKAARVYTSERFLKIQMDNLTEKTKFPVQSFFSHEDANAWLDKR